jgi:hypothetical protein
MEYGPEVLVVAIFKDPGGVVQEQKVYYTVYGPF